MATTSPRASKPRQILTRKADKKARVTLFADFAGAAVVIERVNNVEVRVRKKAGRRFSLSELLAGVTPENIHAEIQTGPSVGKEAW
jgi:hypothetical protein